VELKTLIRSDCLQFAQLLTLLIHLLVAHKYHRIGSPILSTFFYGSDFGHRGLHLGLCHSGEHDDKRTFLDVIFEVPHGSGTLCNIEHHGDDELVEDPTLLSTKVWWNHGSLWLSEGAIGVIEVAAGVMFLPSGTIPFSLNVFHM